VGLNALSANTDGHNTAVGSSALASNTNGFDNTAVGFHALFANLGARRNNAVGSGALSSHTAGNFNNAIGGNALAADQTGASNNAVGDVALSHNISGSNNTAVGDAALLNCSGSDNTALGAAAGRNATTGAGNVYIGSGVQGVAAENNHTYIRNINATTVSGGGTDTVTVNLTTGLIGHLSSSRRYKENISAMDKSSEALYRLKPVTYQYKKEIDPTQSGLIAEEVAEADPNLAIRDRNGEIESLRYTAINAMLLNEFLKEHRKVERLEATMMQQQENFDSQFRQQQNQIEALTAGLQKVTAQIELSKSAPQTVLNKQ